MTEVIRSVFRKYDIRGTAAGENPQITPELARLVGKALGTYMPRTFGTDRMFVGRDNRVTSPPLHAALIDGLVSTGMRVTDIGEVVTPTTYFAASSYGSTGGSVMITGSHLTTLYNGIKMAYGALALADQQIQDLLHIILEDAFTTGQGSVDTDFGMGDKHMDTIKTMVTFKRPLTVVLDAGNGMSGTYVPRILQELGVNLHCLYCESDGTFPNHLPNPEDPETTADLEAKVLEVNADLGLAFDGDADRCGFIDDHGHHISADRLLALLARDVLSRNPGANIVFDVKVSQALPDFIRQHGGNPVMWKTGHSLIKLKMHELNAPLGGEISGHMFWGENYYGFDDAPLVALKTLELIANSGKSISQLFEDIPKLVATPEITLSTPDAVKFEIIHELTEAMRAQTDVITIDGVRALFEGGWGLVRASNTQPAITMRFEAYTVAQLVEYIERFKVLLDTHPEIDQTKLIEHYESFKAQL
ncbi:MAG: phosphomannomutase/phosphoglucomutase [bacterium]|nr:phosphomannomutase/phosphoglucomutase [bacterium]